MEKLPELEPESFVSFLEDLWNERGWETSVKQRPDETYFIVGKRGDGKRGALYVFPTVDSHVKKQHLKKFVGFCRKKGIDVGVVATQGAYADPVRKIAKSKGIHLLDRETLAKTVDEGGFEHVLREYTGGGSPLDRLLATLRSYGVPVPEALPFDFQALLDRLPVGGSESGEGGDGGGAVGGEGGDGGRSASAETSNADGKGDGPTLPGPLTSLPRPDVVLPVALLVLVVFLVGSAVGPALGLPAIGAASGGSGDVSVSALSTAGANATAEVRWNARATDTLTVNGTTYAAPANETFVLVRMNVSNEDSSHLSLDQDSLALEVAGDRYGHQPLNGTTGFAQAGLFAPNDPREVWVAFSVPEDATSGTLVVRDDELTVRFVRDEGIVPEATEPET
ncbi:restriction endonuclease [Halogeometricum limi]|uniref:Restriction endonuclease n=1 Tax=Halogeometricum limi TaxID=555875 RepID=A0A1I6G7N7_9EURY|nr:restriction endonuclease [Halogeometricum limi]SFR38216.1 Restriction endonuclease [Halogeometricum limi]